MLPQRPYDRKDVEEAARRAGPWTPEAEEAIVLFRALSRRATLTDDERRSFAILRQREINETIQRRKEM